MAVMKLACEIEQQLVITITFDDETTKSRVISKGDYISIAYNKNGMRRVINGIVTTIYANPYNPKISRNDWYIILSGDDGGVAKIPINNILDVEVLKQNKFDATVRTPNNSTRVTTIRIYEGTFQVSQDGGHTWFNVGSDGALNDDPVGTEKEITAKLESMIGSDQYASSEELVKGIVELINEEVRKKSRKANTADTIDDNRNVDTTPLDSYDEHNGYRTFVGPDVIDGRVNGIKYVTHK